ncbi:MAG: hypothetical protein NT139_00865 [Candidatus Woesearchaeota archaeon]|nr:hypothetical protein [Candidatus Woesearchaeota archaeon]
MNGENNKLDLEKILKISIPAIDNFIEAKKRVINDLKIMKDDYHPYSNGISTIEDNIKNNEEQLNESIKLKDYYNSLLKALYDKKDIQLSKKDGKFVFEIAE